MPKSHKLKQAPGFLLRQGSNERDRSSAPARSSPVILSEAKDLAADRARPFAARMRDAVRLFKRSSTFLHIEPCLSARKRSLSCNISSTIVYDADLDMISQSTEIAL